MSDSFDQKTKIIGTLNPLKTKVFVHITKTWTPRAFFAAYEYADKSDLKHLSIFNHGWKFIKEILHRIQKGGKTFQIKTTGLEIDGRFIEKEDCKDTLLNLGQMESYCENDSWYLHMEDPSPFIAKSFFYFMNDGVSQLSHEEMRKHFLNLRFYPNTTDDIVVDDCIILFEVEDTELNQVEPPLFKATFWFYGEGDIGDSVTDALCGSCYDLVDLSICDGYGFIKIRSDKLVDSQNLITFLNNTMSLNKILKLVPL